MWFFNHKFVHEGTYACFIVFPVCDTVKYLIESSNYLTLHILRQALKAEFVDIMSTFIYFQIEREMCERKEADEETVVHDSDTESERDAQERIVSAHSPAMA